MKYIIIYLSLLILFSCSKKEEPSTAAPDCVPSRCSDYNSQSSAQAAFNSNPDCKKNLDADKDGTACEEVGNTTSDCVETNCSDYTSQSSAQSAYNNNPGCQNDLDADKDGIACEEPGNTVTICPTTANCGCSNKTKAECQADPCCKWIVGDGCHCK